MRQEVRFVWYCNENNELYDYGYLMHKELVNYLFDKNPGTWMYLGEL